MAGLAVGLAASRGLTKKLAKICTAMVVLVGSARTIRLADVEDGEESGAQLYRAPELGEEACEKTIVYAYGVMLYEVIMIKRIPSEALRRKAMKRIRAGTRPAIPVDSAGFVREIIAKCWSEEPDARPTLREIIAELAKGRYQITEGVDSPEVISFMENLGRLIDSA
jgi:hypothetical protein